MHIEWNRVTWYSWVAAILVFVGTFIVAFNIGILWEKAHIAMSITETPATAQDGGAGNAGGTAGAHCGGFIQNAPTCADGLHCQLDVSRPDTGGTCVPDQAAATVPDWAQGMTVITQASQGQTVELAKDERFAVELGDSLDWTLSWDPDGAITRVPNSIDTGGFQGIYEADTAGTATLTANGRPVCAAGEMCPQFIVNVTVRFDVK